MSGLSAAGLVKDWGAVISVPDTSPSGSTDPPCVNLRQPWQRPKAPSAVSAADLDPAAADFGIRFARGFVAARRRGLFSRRSGRGLLRQLLQRCGHLKWIRHAIRYLERTEERSTAGSGRLSPPQRAVAGAIAISHDPPQRALLRRLLISQGVDPDPVARVLKLDAGVVAAYRALFFEVGDRDREPFRFFAALKLADEEDFQDAGDSGLPPLPECACLGFGMAVAHCGLVVADRGPAADSLALAGDAAEVMGFMLAWRSLRLHADTCLPNAKVVGDAVSKYNKVRGERRAQRFPLSNFMEFMREVSGPSCSPVPKEPKPPPAFTRLTLEDLRWMAGLWLQCAPPASVLPIPRPVSSLQPPWRRSEKSNRGADFPDEMARPDFGCLLARRVAAAGRSEELPAGGSFHWIHLMAAGLETAVPVVEGRAEDAEDAALRRAVELHGGEASRRLLQAALVTTEVEIGEVAECLGLDARVVDAYAMLFFNLPARRGDDSYRHSIESLFQAGRDPLDGGSMPPGRGLAEVMKAAPGITLYDLWCLLGFHAVESRAVDAAYRLLELLCRVARREQNQGYDGNQRRAIESVVRPATKLINIHELGNAALLMNLSSMLIDIYKKVKKKTQFSYNIQMLIDAEGLTMEEAILRLQQSKETRRKILMPPDEKQDETQHVDEDPT